jgi:hypothetical protein
MAEYVNDLPDGDNATDPTDKGLAGEVKQAGLTAENKPSRETNRRRSFGVVLSTFLMLMSAAWAWPAIFLIAERGIPPTWVAIAMGLATMVGMVSAMGMYMMRKWSIAAYLLAVLGIAAILLIVRPSDMWMLIGDAIILAIAVSQMKYLV